MTDPKTLSAYSDLTRKSLTELGGRLFKKTENCVRCGDEVVKTVSDGLCLTCVSYDNAELSLRFNMERMLGKVAVAQCTLESFKTPTDAHAEAKKAAIQFRPDKESLFIQGPCGSGKTHLAIALLLEWASALKMSVGYERVSRMMRLIRGLKGYEESEYISRLASKRLLVIDDLGVGKGTEFTLSILYDIISERVQNGMHGMIITTNLQLDEIAEKFGDDRLTSRIAGMCRILRFDLEDWRLRMPNVASGSLYD